MQGGAAGYRLLPHTADVIVEAWGPSRGTCLRQAALGLVAVFARVDGVAPSARVPLTLPAAPAEDLLVGLLEEVLYTLDAEDAVAVDLVVSETAGGGLTGELLVAPVGAVEQHGAVPKAVARHDLEFRRRREGWHCRVTVDV